MKKNDLILAVIVFVIAGGLFLWQKTAFDASEGTVAIYQEKEKTGVYPLKENRVIEISTLDSGINRLVIENGKVWIAEADCPDGLCIKQGMISKDGQSIICLPHKLVVTIEGGETAKVDAVVR